MIKAVIFDWGGVLIRPHAKERLRFLSNMLGVAESQLEFALKRVMDEFQRGKIEEAQVWRLVCRKLSVPVPKGKSLWARAMQAFYSENEGIWSLIELLRKKGYKVGLLSNTERPLAENFFRDNSRFDAVVFSYQEGTRKPEKRIYEVSFQRLGVRPEEAIMIDDERENLRVARELGASTIHYQNDEHLIVSLKRYGVILD